MQVFLFMKKIVTIGGGTGSFTLLSGLKEYPIRLSAIVSMADNGGSTGVLRDELGVLPPGDVRQCLVALSNSSDSLRKLMNYRFENGGLGGHNFGNILLSALEKVEGGFLAGVKEAEKILNIKGEVIPVTESDVDLYMKLNDGTLLKGERDITVSIDIEKKGIDQYYLNPKAKANKKAIKRIMEADMIVIGPGNLYSSVLPNFLVDGISEAICKSKAIVVFNCNLANKEGQSEGFTLENYADIINKYLRKDRIDFVTFNTKKPSKKLIEKYKKQKEYLVYFDKDIKKNYKVIATNLLSNKISKLNKTDKMAMSRAFIRHDSDKLAKVLMFLLELEENKGLIGKII